MSMPRYPGILFPNRAESLAESAYAGYRVFLDFWNPLAVTLQGYYEALAQRRDTHILVIHAPQGAGKTMFARKLASDYQSTPVDKEPTFDSDNLWHRITAGPIHSSRQALILNARRLTSIVAVTNETPFGGTTIVADRKWIDGLIAKVSGDPDRRWIVVLDNAERGHFLQSLVDLSDIEFVSKRNDSNLITVAAQRFVGHARTTLRGCLFIILTNDDAFAAGLEAAVNSQHSGMLSRASLPLPGPTEKETVVRVNTNRLNSISYWYCLDQAGPTDKIAVHSALTSAATFPDSFAAVDKAIRCSSRLGRRAQTCLLTLVVMTRSWDRSLADSLGNKWRTEVDHQWLQITYFDKGWASPVLPSSRDADLLESEWMLRVVVVGDNFVSHLISGDPVLEIRCNALLSSLESPITPGTHNARAKQQSDEWKKMVDEWGAPTVKTNNFWALGARRSTIYEPVLRRLIPGYNTGGSGFLSYRPDVIISAFLPCSVLSAASSDINDINNAIKREAHVLEFCAFDVASKDNVQKYLSAKLPNYVEITREQ